jgi:hypothetical protein
MRKSSIIIDDNLNISIKFSDFTVAAAAKMHACISSQHVMESPTSDTRAIRAIRTARDMDEETQIDVRDFIAIFCVSELVVVEIVSIIISMEFSSGALPIVGKMSSSHSINEFAIPPGEWLRTLETCFTVHGDLKGISDEIKIFAAGKF